MELQHYNSELEISDDAYAWRYMSFEKTWDIICKRSIYFARLDSFTDPLEGLRSDLRFKLHLKNISKLQPESDVLKQLSSLKQFDVSELEVRRWQQGVFASCWYLTENTKEKNSDHNESLAMWQLYGNQNSFALKIKFNSLIKILTNALETFTDNEVNSAKFGKIEYLNLYELSTKDQNKPILASLIKDKSYYYENEVRFLLLRDNGSEQRIGVRLDISAFFEELKKDITIICHPNLDRYSYDLYKEKFNTVGQEMINSNLLTQKVVQELLIKK